MPCNYLSFSFHSNRLSKLIICLNGISMYLLINLLFFLYLDICLYTANKNDHLLIYIQLVKILLKLISYFFFLFFSSMLMLCSCRLHMASKRCHCLIRLLINENYHGLICYCITFTIFSSRTTS